MLLAYLRAGHQVTAISFDYNQRHKTELDYAKRFCKKFGIDHEVIDLTAVYGAFAKDIKSSLINPDIEVPEGHYEAPNMIQTVVPMRNTIMMTIAAAKAASIGATSIAAAMHAGDHTVYADCRPEYTKAMAEVLLLADDTAIALLTPFVYISKSDIASIGNSLGLNWNETWSCYKGGKTHCGKCGTCVERLEALEEAKKPDRMLVNEIMNKMRFAYTDNNRE